MPFTTTTQAGKNKVQTHQFGLVFSHATIGIVVTDSSGKIINFNQHAEKQFGYQKAEIIGKKVELLIPGEYHTLHGKERAHFLEQPEPRQMGAGRDLFAQKKDGVLFPVEISLSPYSLEGETFVIAFIVDITIRKNAEAVVLKQKAELQKVSHEISLLNVQLEQKVDARTRMLQETLMELEKSKEELSEALENEKQMNELKSRFVTLASHEFRTPLSAILSSTFLLEKYNDKPAPEQRMKHIRRIKNAVLGLKDILDDFLSVGKLEEGKVKNKRQKLIPADLKNLILGAIEDLEEMLKPGQHIELNFDSKTALDTDPGILKNIMINLISNAIKFSGELGLIQVDCTEKEEEVSIAIRDQGMGIPKEDMKRLKERFFRAGNAAHIQGTGLGLHIVKRYLELIQGRMEIQSVLEEGSCFIIYLPKE